jgi:hypothetical protein
VQLHAGGVEVSTADTDFSSAPLPELPVDGTAASTDVPLDAAPVEALPFEDLSLGELDLGFAPLPLDSFDTVADLPIAEPVTAVAGAAEERATRSRTAALVPSRFEDSNAGAAAAVVGAIALLGALGLSMGERLRARRTARRIP